MIGHLYYQLVIGLIWDLAKGMFITKGVTCQELKLLVLLRAVVPA